MKVNFTIILILIFWSITACSVIERYARPQKDQPSQKNDIPSLPQKDQPSEKSDIPSLPEQKKAPKNEDKSVEIKDDRYNCQTDYVLTHTTEYLETTTWLNMRSGPSISCGVIKVLGPKTKVLISGITGNNWCLVQINDDEIGFLNKKFLRNIVNDVDTTVDGPHQKPNQRSTADTPLQEPPTPEDDCKKIIVYIEKDDGTIEEKYVTTCKGKDGSFGN